MQLKSPEGLSNFFEITPRNYNQFFPKVYSELSLPASSLIFAGKEPRAEISKLEELRARCEQINLEAIIDLRKNKTGIVDKYGIDPESLKNCLNKNQLERERYIFNLIKSKGFDVEFDETTRVVSINYGGKKIYGSVYSILDTNPDILLFEPTFRKFETSSSSQFEHIMSLKTDEGDAYRVLNSVSGSQAQNEINSYPSDFDFKEFIEIRTETMEDGIEELRKILIINFQKFVNSKEIQITEFKIGKYRYIDVDGNAQEIKLNWNLEELQKGEKIVHIDGKDIIISFSQNIQNLEPSDLIKFDYLTIFSGIFKDCSKIIDFRLKKENQECLYEHIFIPFSCVQDIYFDDPSKFDLVSKTSDQEIIFSFYQSMIDHFNLFIECDLGSEKCNPLKAAKRAYNILKISSLIQKGREISSIFNSELSRIYQIGSDLDTHSIVLKKVIENKNEDRLINLENLIDSLNFLINDIEGDENVLTFSISRYLQIIVNMLKLPNPNLEFILDRIKYIKKKISKEVNGKIYDELLSHHEIIDILDGVSSKIED